MVSFILRVYEFFRLSDGSTIVACDKPPEGVSLKNRKVKLALDGSMLCSFIVIGERKMLRQSANFDKIALETRDPIELRSDDMADGMFELLF